MFHGKQFTKTVMAEFKVNNNGNENKEHKSVALSGEVINAMLKTSNTNNLSVSEIAEYAIRKLYGMPTDGYCKSRLKQVFAA